MGIPEFFSDMTDLEVQFWFNPLMPGGSKKVTHTETNWQFSAAGLLKYV